jgi:hypothetical protein
MTQVPNGVTRRVLALIWLLCAALVAASLDRIPDPPATKDAPGASQTSKLIEQHHPFVDWNRDDSPKAVQICAPQASYSVEFNIEYLPRYRACRVLRAGDSSPPRIAS